MCELQQRVAHRLACATTGLSETKGRLKRVEEGEMETGSLNNTFEKVWLRFNRNIRSKWPSVCFLSGGDTKNTKNIKTLG